MASPQRSIVIPPVLRPGGTVGVVAPASPVPVRSLETGVRYLEDRGYRVIEGRHCRRTHGFLAGTDAQRAADLNRMFRDDRVDAVFCARGGYGTPRLLDLVDYDAVRADPKPLVGFSDVTALQLALYAHTGLVSYYGPMCAVDMKPGMNRFTERHLWRMLEKDVVSLDAARAGWRVYRKGDGSGPLVGGCLSLVAPLVGTPYLPDMTGCVLFIEDVNEDPYELDRMFQQLRLAGVLGCLAGLVVGRMPGCTPRKRPSFTLDDVLKDAARHVHGPVVANADFGHVAAKLTLPNGRIARVSSASTVIDFID